MPDNPPLGPTGQSSNPNPFQQGASTNLSINTSQAQRAMEDLQRSLDGMMKSFGGTWEKVTTDRLAAEERFYRAVGDKARARQKELERYSKDAIDLIDAETKAKIQGYEKEKLSQDELHKRTTDLTKKAAEDKLRINQEVQRKLASERGIGGLLRGATSSIGESIGGPIGGLVSGAGNLLTNPFALIGTAIFETWMANARSARVGSLLAGAGMGLGVGAGVGTGFASNLFGGSASRLGVALGAGEQARLIETMAGSRTMIDQARGGGFGAIAGNLGLFANILPDASKEMELFTDATKSLGMSQKDITDTFMASRVNAERLKITQIDAIRTQMEMQRALRNITNDGTVASTVLFNITDYLTKIGASEAEKVRIGGAIGAAGANLSLPQLAGMFAFTHGGKMPTPENMFGPGGAVGEGTFPLLGNFLTQIGKQFTDPTQRMFAAGQLQQQFLPGLRLQDIPKFFDLTNSMMKGTVGGAEFGKQFRELEGKTPQVAAAEGINKLVEIVGPVQMIENFISNFWRDLDSFVIKYFGRHDTDPNSYLHNLPSRNVGKNASIGRKFE